MGLVLPGYAAEGKETAGHCGNQTANQSRTEGATLMQLDHHQQLAWESFKFNLTGALEGLLQETMPIDDE